MNQATVLISIVLSLSCFAESANNSPLAQLYYRPGIRYPVNSQHQEPELQYFLPLKLEPYSPPALYPATKTQNPAEPTTLTNDTAADEPLGNKRNTATDTRKFDDKTSNEKLTEELETDEPSDHGVYYIYHPDGVLQKVVYRTKDDVKNMAYSAQLKYENVQPITDPIYSYDPKTLAWQNIQL